MGSISTTSTAPILTSSQSSSPQPTIPASTTAAAQANIVHIVHSNLKNHHRWTNLRVHTSSLSTSTLTSSSASFRSSNTVSSTSASTTTTSSSRHRHSTTFFPRPVITGLPPTRIYVSPDEDPMNAPTEPEEEWVLPTDLKEKWSVSRMAGVFDAIPDMEEEIEVDAEDGDDGDEETGEGEHGGESAMKEGGGKGKRIVRRKKGKRILMAAVAEDSTVVYYLIHDGVVKPRQN